MTDCLVNKELNGVLLCEQKEPTFSYPEINICILNLGLATDLTVALALFIPAYLSRYLDLSLIMK